jgi:hypothetical protein
MPNNPDTRVHSTNPESYGWKKIGSNQTSRVELYAKDNYRMDYYPTTGNLFSDNRIMYYLVLLMIDNRDCKDLPGSSDARENANVS